MKTTKLLFLPFLAAAAFSGCDRNLPKPGPEGLALVKGGAGQAEIIVGESPARMAAFGAKELQTYIEKMSGAKLPIVAEPSPDAAVKIFVGKSRFTDELGIGTDGLKHGAFRMASGPDWIALLGPDKDFEPVEPWGRDRSNAETARVNAEWDKITGDTFWNNFRDLHGMHLPEQDIWLYDDTGTLFAVYEFLREQGVRWFAPGELGEVVPQKPTITVPEGMDKTVVPDFPLRTFRYFNRAGRPELALYNLRLGGNEGHDLIGFTQPCHGLKFVLMREEMKKAHPEMYAVFDGKRATGRNYDPGSPCLSSPLLFDKHLKYARAVFDHYKEPMVSLDMPDGYGARICEEEACKSQGTPDRGQFGAMSDYVYKYINRVAGELYKSHPDRMVSGLIYSAYQLPPEKIGTLSPNLALIECRNRGTFYDKERQEYSRGLREGWLEKLPSKKYFTWDYYLTNRPEEAGFPAYYPRLIAEDLRELKGVSSGEIIEVYNHRADNMLPWDEFTTNHLNQYITSRLWWDADQDLDALLEDYYTNFYGPAREEMKAFIEYSEANWPEMRKNPEKISAALELLEKARKAAPPDTVYAERIGRLVEYVKPLEPLRQQLSKKRESDLSYRVLIASQSGSDMKNNPIDGRLEPESWPEVRRGNLRNATDGGHAKPPTWYQVFREGDFLYFAIFCSEPDMAKPAISTTANNDPKIFDGDFVSLLFETNTHAFYEIAVNPTGAVFEKDHGEGASETWTSKAAVGAFQGDNFWSVEIRLPILGEGARVLDRNVGADGARPRLAFPWHFNIIRGRARDGKQSLFACSPIGNGDLRNPEKFAEMWGK